MPKQMFQCSYCNYVHISEEEVIKHEQEEHVQEYSIVYVKQDELEDATVQVSLDDEWLYMKFITGTDRQYTRKFKMHHDIVETLSKNITELQQSIAE